MSGKNCVIVTSVIYPDSAPLDYSNTRSIYSPEQRYQQTVETIHSVRAYLPGADICLVECSPPSQELDNLKEQVEVFLNLYPNDNIRKNPAKGVGEACMLYAALDNLDSNRYENFFKLSGRYVLNSRFNIEAYMNNKVVLKRTMHYGGDSMHTFFYKFPSTEKQFFKNLFKLAALDSHTSAIEVYMLKHMDMTKVLHLEAPMGIIARWSCYDTVAHF